MNQKLRILIVDDDRRIVSTLADILALPGYVTSGTFSAEDAIEQVKRVSFDCVLTDIKMSGMNGVKLCQEVHKHQPGLPVIFMTAYADDELIRQGLECGVVGVMNKPLDIHQLLGFLAALDNEHVVTVVDDDPAFCETLVEILQRRGFHATKVTDPYMNIDKMVEAAQIVLLDLKLKDVSGYDVLKEIRVLHPDLPVLLVTGYRQEMASVIEKALELNVFTCLYKPLVIPELLQKLAEIQSARLKKLLKKG